MSIAEGVLKLYRAAPKRLSFAGCEFARLSGDWRKRLLRIGQEAQKPNGEFVLGLPLAAFHSPMPEQSAAEPPWGPCPLDSR